MLTSDIINSVKQCFMSMAVSKLHCVRCAIPAVNHYRSTLWNGALGSVDLLQETQDSSRFIGNTVIRPAQVLIVPDTPRRLSLYKKHQIIKQN